MIVAIATLKRMSISRKRRLRHKLSKRGIEFPKKFDKKMHTLVYDSINNKFFESQMKQLQNPKTTVFVKEQTLVDCLLTGIAPLTIQNFVKNQMIVGSTSNVEEAMKSANVANDKAIEYHTTTKPMLRKELKKMKRDELIEQANSRKVDLTHNGKLTKQVIIDKIVEQLLEDEKVF